MIFQSSFILITDGRKQPLNIFECPMKVIKNSEDYADRRAKDSLGARALACFLMSGQIQITDGVKYEAKVFDDDNVEMDNDKKDNIEEVKKYLSIFQLNA